MKEGGSKSKKWGSREGRKRKTGKERSKRGEK